jgi:spermidine/putrescine transport system permease protein
VLALYVALAIAFGGSNMFQLPIPVWEPWFWTLGPTRTLISNFQGHGFAPIDYTRSIVNTLEYVVIAGSLCLIIGYPVAYTIARYGGKRKPLLLVALILPFWVSYLMRMLAWVNLLQTDGYVNRILVDLGIISQPYPWLEGHSVTVILGMVYGYIPYMILPLYGGLDRIGNDLLEASRDLGGNPFRTFWRVTLPLSRQAIMAGLVIAALPMFGDYYTTYMLSGRGAQYMIGSIIDFDYSNNLYNEAALLVILLMLFLMVPLLYYLRSTDRELTRT